MGGEPDSIFIMVYLADTNLIQSRIRGAGRMTGTAVFLGVLGVAALAIFLSMGWLTWVNAILIFVLIAVSIALLIRTQKTKTRLRGDIGKRYAVSDSGIELLSIGVIPWENIVAVLVIDTSHQLTQMRANAATGAGFGVYALTLAINDAKAMRERYGKAVSVGSNDVGVMSVELDSVIGIEAARDALSRTTDAARSKGISVSRATSMLESMSFMLEAMGESHDG